MTTIIDYGIGNLRSIEKAFQAVGVEVLRTDRPEDIECAERLVLPGVGAFGACAAEIRRRNLEEPIQAAINAGTPFLGVCVGMQLLFEIGEELGTHRGLGILPGRVVRFDGATDQQTPQELSTDMAEAEPETTKPLKVPHMGWNTVTARYGSPLLAGIEENAFFYFVHSYHAKPARPEDVLGVTNYGITFPSVVARNNVLGVQFHPEKSQQNGLNVLKNFSKLSV